jgi:hypothetical protein
MVWKYNLDIADVWPADGSAGADDDRTEFLRVRDEITKRIRQARWSSRAGLEDILPGLEQSDDVEEFDGWWAEFYDWCDDNRVWVNRFR